MSEQSQYHYFVISETKIRIARTYYLNLIYFCRKYTIFTRCYEFMIQKVLKFANYAVAVLVLKIMLSCPNYAKNYASTIRQCLHGRGEGNKVPAAFFSETVKATVIKPGHRTPCWLHGRHLSFFEKFKNCSKSTRNWSKTLKMFLICLN